MEFLIVRHGETDSNKEKRVQGHNQDPLNKKGIQQMKKVASKLRNKNISLILSSDIIRAKQSAKIIARDLGIKKIIYYKGLREKDNGFLTGKKSIEINWELIEGSFEKKRAPGGESLEAVLCRVKKFLNLINKRYSNEKILAVSHGTFIKLLIGYTERSSIKESILKKKIENGKLIKVRC